MFKKLGENKSWLRVIIATFVFLAVTPCVLLFRRVTEVKTTFTVLKRNRGKWSEEEATLLADNLDAQVSSEPLNHPDILIIVGEFGLNKVRDAFDQVKITEKSGKFKTKDYSVKKFREFSYELVVGLRNKKLPFRPALYEKLPDVDWPVIGHCHAYEKLSDLDFPAIGHWHSPAMYKPGNMTGIKGEEEKNSDK